MDSANITDPKTGTVVQSWPVWASKSTKSNRMVVVPVEWIQSMQHSWIHS